MMLTKLTPVPYDTNKILLCLKHVEIRFIASFNSMLLEYTLKCIHLKTEFNMYYIWGFSPYRTENTVSKAIIAVCSQKSTKHISPLHKRSVDLKELMQNCEKHLLFLSCMFVRPSFLLSLCMSVCLSVCMEQLGSNWTDFHKILYLSIFRKLWRYLPEFSLEWDAFQTRAVEKFKHTLYVQYSFFI